MLSQRVARASKKNVCGLEEELQRTKADLESQQKGFCERTNVLEASLKEQRAIVEMTTARLNTSTETVKRVKQDLSDCTTARVDYEKAHAVIKDKLLKEVSEYKKEVAKLKRIVNNHRSSKTQLKQSHREICNAQDAKVRTLTETISELRGQLSCAGALLRWIDPDNSHVELRKRFTPHEGSSRAYYERTVQMRDERFQPVGDPIVHAFWALQPEDVPAKSPYMVGECPRVLMPHPGTSLLHFGGAV